MLWRALALSAALAFATPAGAQGPYGPIACVYDGLKPAERARIDIDNIDSPANTALLEPVFETCMRRHKWPAELFAPVVVYTMHRLGFERAENEIAQLGGKRGEVERVWTLLTEDQRASVTDSDVEAVAVIANAAPSLASFAAAGVTALSNFTEMKRMEAAWARLG